MFTLEEAKEILANLEYKPNWMFSAEEYWSSGHKFISIEIIATVPDTYRIKPQIDAKTGAGFDPEETTEESFLQVLYEKIMWLEEHEAAEWFMYKGKRIRNPHGPKLER